MTDESIFDAEEFMLPYLIHLAELGAYLRGHIVLCTWRQVCSKPNRASLIIHSLLHLANRPLDVGRDSHFGFFAVGAPTHTLLHAVISPDKYRLRFLHTSGVSNPAFIPLTMQ
jgi:hypothetical protein